MKDVHKILAFSLLPFPLLLIIFFGLQRAMSASDVHFCPTPPLLPVVDLHFIFKKDRQMALFP